jgi:hypothetical protein
MKRHDKSGSGRQDTYLKTGLSSTGIIANSLIDNACESLGRRVAHALLSRGSWLRFDAKVVVHSSADSLLAPQVPLGRLDGNMSE